MAKNAYTSPRRVAALLRSDELENRERIIEEQAGMADALGWPDVAAAFRSLSRC